MDVPAKKTSDKKLRKQIKSVQWKLLGSINLKTNKVNLSLQWQLQLFQERLSYKNVKAYTAMSKGITGNAGQRLLDSS